MALLDIFFNLVIKKYVVQYYDSFEEDGKLNIIMEYCDSGDLNDFLEKHKQTKHLLSENLVWKIFIKITGTEQMFLKH